MALALVFALTLALLLFGLSCPGLAWLGLALLGLAWLGLAWLGLVLLASNIKCLRLLCEFGIQGLGFKVWVYCVGLKFKV